jgi:ABC-type transport system involved in multi-copper enzyme maturation permease subunit
MAVVRFLGRRAFTGSRLAWWLLLAAFPGALVLLIQGTSPDDQQPPPEAWLLLLYVLIPCVTCVAGTFLWVTATVQSEIDAKTWIYLATRPYGVTSLLVGNYVVAVAWTVSVAMAALAIVLTLMPSEEVTDRWRAFAGLILLAAPAYASVYALIGVLFIKRAMFVAVAYTLVFEMIMGFMPAVINKLTIQYRLRSLAFRWLDLDQLPPELATGLREVLSDAPPYQHVVILIATAVAFLGIAVWLVGAKETSLGAESDF